MGPRGWYGAVVAVCLGSLCVAGCEKGGPARPEAEKTKAKAEGEVSPDRVRSPLVILDPGGARLYTLEPTSGGYRILDGHGARVGRVKVQPGQVKVRTGGRTVAKVKRKVPGFKLIVDGTTLFRARRKGGAFEIRSRTGEALGRLDAAQGSVGEARLQVLAVGEKAWQVNRDGKAITRVEGDISEQAVLLMGLPDRKLLERVALLVYADEAR